VDIDVIRLEASRPQMEVFDELSGRGFTRAVGPGVYDVHSPRIPSAHELEELLKIGLQAVGPGRLWVNPDCGLKTRRYEEIEPSLRNLVDATRTVRNAAGSGPS
jgi:5-methyltetrahydropteroyltriglutamate--homocysteine methyltransferase